MKQIESAVASLTPTDLAEFSEWFEEFLAAKWDRQFEADVRAGKFERIAKRVDEEFESGHCKPL